MYISQIAVFTYSTIESKHIGSFEYEEGFYFHSNNLLLFLLIFFFTFIHLFFLFLFIFS